MSLQKLTMPICTLVGSLRFITVMDFQAQACQAILIECFIVTVPFIALTIVYGAHNDRMIFYSSVGVFLHIVNLILTIKHAHYSQFDESRPCLLVDSRTCHKVRNFSIFRCFGPNVEDEHVRNP